MGVWIWYFLIYSFMGYWLEVAYSLAVQGHGRGRKCLLLLPLCPVYGVGATGIVALCTPTVKPVWVVLVGFVVATATEMIFGLFYKYVLKVNFWDYSQVPGNVGGLICIPFSLVWSGLSLVLVYGIHPVVQAMVGGIPPGWATPVGIVLALDCLVSAVALRREGNTGVLQWYR